jgi:hypothetical protein
MVHDIMSNSEEEETSLTIACSMAMHDMCQTNIEDVRKCGCKCHIRR